MVPVCAARLPTSPPPQAHAHVQAQPHSPASPLNNIRNPRHRRPREPPQSLLRTIQPFCQFEFVQGHFLHDRGRHRHPLPIGTHPANMSPNHQVFQASAPDATNKAKSRVFSCIPLSRRVIPYHTLCAVAYHHSAATKAL